MGELLLCNQELASVPYYLEDMALNIYSLEELCYYLNENIDLIEPSFMEMELVHWINTELKLTALSEKLSKLIKEGGGLLEFVSLIVTSCNYCSKEELIKMQEVLSAFANKSEVECRKIRADRYLEKKRYRVSILEYQKLLESPEVTGILEGNICHNLGTAYVGLFFFEEAAVWYHKAYTRNQNPASLRQKELALQIAAGNIPTVEMEENGQFEMPEMTLKQWIDSYQRNCR